MTYFRVQFKWSTVIKLIFFQSDRCTSKLTCQNNKDLALLPQEISVRSQLQDIWAQTMKLMVYSCTDLLQVSSVVYLNLLSDACLNLQAEVSWKSRKNKKFKLKPDYFIGQVFHYHKFQTNDMNPKINFKIRIIHKHSKRQLFHLLKHFSKNGLISLSDLSCSTIFFTWVLSKFS